MRGKRLILRFFEYEQGGEIVINLDMKNWDSELSMEQG